MTRDAALSITTADLTVRDALEGHYVAHGLPADGGEHEAWFGIRIGPLTIRLPNPPARRRAGTAELPPASRTPSPITLSRC